MLALWNRLTACHHAGLKWYHFLLTPFGCMTMSLLYLHSAYLVHTGGRVNWKGRRYVVNIHKTIENEDGQVSDQKSRAGKLVSRDVTD